MERVIRLRRLGIHASRRERHCRQLLGIIQDPPGNRLIDRVEAQRQV